MVSQGVYIDEKQLHSTGQESEDRMVRPPRQSVLRRFVPITLLVFAILFLFRSTLAGHASSIKQSGTLQRPLYSEGQDGTKSQKVAMEAHIMSKCPDAKDCLQQLVVPAMVQVSDKVDFLVSYIGKFVTRFVGLEDVQD